jgi:hypothetical protein
MDHETKQHLAVYLSNVPSNIPIHQDEAGVTVELPNGQKVFFDRRYLQVLKLRNRGKD